MDDDFRERILEQIKDVKASLNSLSGNIESLKDNVYPLLTTIQVEIATLKVKSSLWGGAAGALTVAVALGVEYFVNRGGR